MTPELCFDINEACQLMWAERCHAPHNITVYLRTTNTSVLLDFIVHGCSVSRTPLVSMVFGSLWKFRKFFWSHTCQIIWRNNNIKLIFAQMKVDHTLIIDTTVSENWKVLDNTTITAFSVTLCFSTSIWYTSSGNGGSPWQKLWILSSGNVHIEVYFLRSV